MDVQKTRIALFSAERSFSTDRRLLSCAAVGVKCPRALLVSMYVYLCLLPIPLASLTFLPLTSAIRIRSGVAGSAKLHDVKTYAKRVFLVKL